MVIDFKYVPYIFYSREITGGCFTTLLLADCINAVRLMVNIRIPNSNYILALQS